MDKKTMRLVKKIVKGNPGAMKVANLLLWYIRGVEYIKYLKKNSYVGGKLWHIFIECDHNDKKLVNRIEIEIERKKANNRLNQKIKDILFR